jgi:hypothetical protein
MCVDCITTMMANNVLKFPTPTAITMSGQSSGGGSSQSCRTAAEAREENKRNPRFQWTYDERLCVILAL